VSRGGAREGAGRNTAQEHLKKVPYNTKLPQWLRDWLTGPEREESGPVMIEKALRRMYKLRPPCVQERNDK
jgi:hypothetical protein